MPPNPQAPGYKEGIGLRKSTILHPTDFGQIKAASLPLASNYYCSAAKNRQMFLTFQNHA